MANCYNVIYGILIASAFCTLVCCSRLHTSGDIYNRGSSNERHEFGDSSESNVDQNINGMGSGDTYIMYKDCSHSRITTHIDGKGSGDTYLLYGYSSASSSPVPIIASYPEIWAKNMFTIGSGDLTIQYGNCASSSASTMVQNVKNVGSGDVRVMIKGYDRANVGHTITNVGTGTIYVKYANSGSYAQRRTNNVEQLAHNVYNLRSEEIHIYYGKPTNVTKNAGMGTAVNGPLSNMIENHLDQGGSK